MERLLRRGGRGALKNSLEAQRASWWKVGVGSRWHSGVRAKCVCVCGGGGPQRSQQDEWLLCPV